jgi:hypothetical protein
LEWIKEGKEAELEEYFKDKGRVFCQNIKEGIEYLRGNIVVKLDISFAYCSFGVFTRFLWYLFSQE